MDAYVICTECSPDNKHILIVVIVTDKLRPHFVSFED